MTTIDWEALDYRKGAEGYISEAKTTQTDKSLDDGQLFANAGNPLLITAAAMKLQASQATPKQDIPRKRPSEPPVADMMAPASINLFAIQTYRSSL